MTDNEKAASFIGWKPGTKCDSWWGANSSFGRAGECRCVVCRAVILDCRLTNQHCHETQHDIPAPDMSRPENYMRALEVVGQRYSIQHTIRHLVDRAIKHRLDISSRDDLYADSGTYIGADFAELGVNALAAIYDAEHEEPA